MDGRLIQQIVAIIERDLRRRISPELTTASARLQIDHMSRLLQWISAQVGEHDTLESAHGQALQILLGSERLPAVPRAFYEPQAVPAEIEMLRRVAAAPASDGSLFDRYVEIEKTFVESLDAEGGKGFGDVYQGGKRAGVKEEALPTCDAPTLTKYLQERFDAPGAAASGVTPLAGGFGKDTVLFTIEGCGAFDGRAVIRKDFFVRPGPTPVTSEFQLLRSLHDLDFPVAEPLWSEPDAAIVGGPFIVSRCVDGDSAASGWQDSPELRRHFVDKFASLLARLHGLTADRVLGLGDLGMRTAVQNYMKLYYDHYRARARTVSGRIEAGFAWLAANLVATDDRPASLVHGDVGFHNILMKAGEINALLDWEFAHFGDPAEDIGYCWQFIETLVSWDDFMAMYAAHGGTPVSYELASFYRVWGDIRNAAMGVGALGTIELSDEADIRSPSCALAFGPLLELQALTGAAQWNTRNHAVSAGPVG